MQLTQACDINIVKGNYFDIRVKGMQNIITIPKVFICVGFQTGNIIILVERNWSLKRRKRAGLKVTFLDLLAFAC